MKVPIALTVIGMVAAGAAAAQSQVTPPPPQESRPGNPSVREQATQAPSSDLPAGRTIDRATATDGQLVSMSLLEAGANSFTESQARSRIESAGFTAITGLRKDDRGIWRGSAQRDGRVVSVGLDYRGNVASQ